MKKFLLIFAFIISSLCMNAQCNCKCDSLKTYYISVMYNTHGNAILGDPFKKGDFYVTDNKGQDVIFDTSINLINFFADKGWEYVESGRSESRPTFLFKKRAKSKIGLLDNIKLRRFFSL